MLKRFFISMLGSMAALWLSLVIFIIVVVAAAVLFVAKNMGESVKPLQSENILHIKLSGAIPERETQFQIDDILYGGLEVTETLSDIIAAIDQAATDKKIKGIYLDCRGADLGIASRSEIMASLINFKKTGKWIYAYADSYQQGDYYVATAADVVALNPVGELNIHGVGSTVIFFKNLLDKLGIEVQIVKVGSFKSAVEPFIRTDMSEPSKLQTSVYVNQIWDCIVAEIAMNRDISESTVRHWADSLSMTWDPMLYIEQKAVNSLAYRHDLEQQIRDRMGLKSDEDLPLVTPSAYLQNNSQKAPSADDPHIAVLYAVGDIVNEGIGGIVAEDIVPQIYELAENDKVKGMVLRVNSGGGSAFASEQIWKALEDFKAKGKTLYVSMGDMAASGGYYISCGAKVIYADPTTLTGSIGIFGMIPNAQKLLTDKIGINFETVQSSPNASFPAIYQAATPEQLQAMQAYVERGYETFVSRVSRGRDISVDSVKVIGGGRVWDGLTAKNIGLVDSLGTLDDAVKALACELNMDPKARIDYPQIENGWLNTLLKELNNQGISTQVVDPRMAASMQMAQEMIKSSPLQARSETIVVR